MNTRHVVVDTNLGPITIVAVGEAVCGLFFERHAGRPAVESFGPRVLMSEDCVLREAGQQLVEYLDGKRRRFDLRLEPAGDAFQMSVWAIIDRIPFGKTSTYGKVANELGDRSLAQEVGQAVGANPLCIFVPCHRVVGSTGALNGYAGGLGRKRALLDLESWPWRPSPSLTGDLTFPAPGASSLRWA